MRLSISCLRNVLVVGGLFFACVAIAEPPKDFDTRVEAVMRDQGVPGMAISIVEGGKTVLAKGYGVRRLGSAERVDADTLFVIGSTSKAFTSAALAVLVDEGRIGWDDKVIDHLPGFRMYDPWVTREMTILDLLVHRSGLGLGQGDLLFVPRTSRSRADIVHALRDMKLATSFRSAYAYDNVLYVVAGELIQAVSGQTWEMFVRDHLLRPAGMNHSTSSQTELFATANRAQPHARLDGRFRGIGNQQVLDVHEALPEVAAPAGGIASSANDFARWLIIQLQHGALPGADKDGARLFSEAASQEMWTPQVHVPISPLPEPVAAATPQFSSYALGWDVQDYRGVKILQHGGAVFGLQTFVVLIPEKNVGFSLQINSEDSVILMGLAYELLDHYLDAPKRDWVADFAAFRKARVTTALAALDGIEKANKVNKASRPSLPAAGYAGNYADPWYGPIAISDDKGKLRIDFRQTPNMAGTLQHWQYDTFRTVWDDRTIEPAYVTFALDADGKVDRITLKPVSPLADFSFDYKDLLFTPVHEK